MMVSGGEKQPVTVGKAEMPTVLVDGSSTVWCGDAELHVGLLVLGGGSD